MALFNARTIIFLHPTALHSPTLTPSSSLSQYARFALSDTTLACSQSLRPYKNQHRHCYLKTTERPSTKRRRHASPRRTCKPSQVRAKSSKREPVRIAKPSSVQDQHRHPYLYSAGRSSTKRRRHQSTPYLQALQSESIVFQENLSNPISEAACWHLPNTALVTREKNPRSSAYPCLRSSTQ